MNIGMQQVNSDFWNMTQGSIWQLLASHIIQCLSCCVLFFYLLILQHLLWHQFIHHAASFSHCLVGEPMYYAYVHHRGHGLVRVRRRPVFSRRAADSISSRENLSFTRRVGALVSALFPNIVPPVFLMMYFLVS